MERMVSDYMVYLGSPLKGMGDARAQIAMDFDRNIRWAQGRCHDLATMAGVTPYAPHAFFPFFLNDKIEAERQVGMDGGLVTLKRCNEVLFYLPPWREDFSEGMKREWDSARTFRIPVYNVHDENTWVEYLLHLRKRAARAPLLRVG